MKCKRVPGTLPGATSPSMCGAGAGGPASLSLTHDVSAEASLLGVDTAPMTEEGDASESLAVEAWFQAGAGAGGTEGGLVAMGPGSTADGMPPPGRTPRDQVVYQCTQAGKAAFGACP